MINSKNYLQKSLDQQKNKKINSMNEEMKKEYDEIKEKWDKEKKEIEKLETKPFVVQAAHHISKIINPFTLILLFFGIFLYWLLFVDIEDCDTYCKMQSPTLMN